MVFNLGARFVSKVGGLICFNDFGNEKKMPQTSHRLLDFSLSIYQHRWSYDVQAFWNLNN